MLTTVAMYFSESAHCGRCFWRRGKVHKLFELPNVEIVSECRNGEYDAVSLNIREGDVFYGMELIRPEWFPDDVPFMAVGLSRPRDRTVVWKKKPNDKGCVHIAAAAHGRVVIACVEKGKGGSLRYVLDPVALLSGEESSPSEIAYLKREVVRWLGKEEEHVLCDAEKALARSYEAEHNLKETAGHVQAEEEKQARRAEKAARHKARVAALKDRGQVTAYTGDSRKVCGVPVVDEEWQVLPHGTKVVLVGSYSESSGEAGQFLEAFAVCKRNGGNPKKERVVKGLKREIPSYSGSEDTFSLPEPEGRISVLNERDKKVPVKVFGTVDDIRAVREAGLHLGSYVTAKDKLNPDGRYEVYRLVQGKTETIGLVSPVR